jgi:hypothetical protein
MCGKWWQWRGGTASDYKNKKKKISKTIIIYIISNQNFHKAFSNYEIVCTK